MDTFRIEVGDEVAIARIVKKQDGWNNEWASSMDTYVGDGAVYLVTNISARGVKLTHVSGDFRGCRAAYVWPPASLDKVHDLFDVEET